MKQFLPKVLLLMVLIYAQQLSAQVTDNFGDGNFTANPTWTGNTADWIVNAAQQLQSNNLIANSQYYLSTPNTIATTTQWDLYAQLAFNTSSANYVDVFLTASASDVTLAGTTGYFVRLGNTTDEISLYRKDPTGITKIIDGTDDVLNNSNNTLRLRVIRGAGNQFTLQRDMTGTGNAYITEGIATDATYTTSAFFCIYVKQSTATFFQKHFFDDISVKVYAPDITPPALQSITALSPATVDVLFDEPLDISSAQNPANYSVGNGIGNPSSAIRDAINLALVHLSFSINFPNGVNNTLTINGVKDLSGNATINATGTFNFYIPQRYDVVIDEIFADPTPTIALPNAEFIEVKNISGKAINMQGWRVTGGTTISGALPAYTLPADSFLVLTSTANSVLFTSYGRVLSISSFPSLDNNGSTLSLVSKEGITIHAISYNTGWYQNAVKSDGGWTLEMIDTRNPCSAAANWRASIDPRGGTPAVKNSIDAVNRDQTGPALTKASAIDSVTIQLLFDEPLDSLRGATAGNYTISDGINLPASAMAIGPLYNKVQLKLSTPIVRNKVYTVTANNVADCAGNSIGTLKTTRLGLASVIDSFGIIINEILFNPKSAGTDYVELYNRSNSIFDLKDLYLANRSSSTNQLATIRQVSMESLPLFPGDFYVLSENQLLIKQNYMVTNPDNFIDIPGIPSYPDDKGAVVLLNAQGNVVDEVRYDAKWHFELIDNEEGIALERIDYNKASQDKNNWHSAASTAGFGTPSYKNSQFRNDVTVQGDITITPKIFSPNNDGFDDFAVITYQLADPNYVANITIYDAAGRPVKNLAKNATLAQTGSFRWDGLDDKLNKVNVGTYIIYTEIFNLAGKKRSFKNAVIVAAKL